MTRNMNRRRWLQQSSWAAVAGLPTSPATATYQDTDGDRIDADLLFRGGTIHDGTGGAPKIGDVAICGERIAAVGRFDIGKADRIIDCTGLVVAPGFIDLHTHSDRSVVQPALRNCMNYLTQGCTTSVTGNCGLGPKDTAAYLDGIDERGAGTNIVHLVPHGPLREAAMKNAPRPANAEELESMKGALTRSMRAGAWGMSTGLYYNWSCYADLHELVELAKVVAAHGGIYVSHIRNEADRLVKSVNEALEIGRLADLPVHISHFKAKGKPNWGTVREAAERIEQARQQGQKVTADQYPYAASFTSAAATLLPEGKISGGRRNLFQRMEADRSFANRVREVVLEHLENAEKIVVVTCKQPAWRGKSLAEIAAESGKSRVDVALELIRMGGGTALNFCLCEADVRYVMTIPWVATASDGWGHQPGSAATCHPRVFGTFPRKIGRYAIREKVLPLEQAIRSATGLPADILGLPDRGYLREGFYADLVVLDPKTFIDQATFEKPAVYSSGVRYLTISGNLAIAADTPTKGLFGRPLRHSC